MAAGGAGQSDGHDLARNRIGGDMDGRVMFAEALAVTFDEDCRSIAHLVRNEAAQRLRAYVAQALRASLPLSDGH